MGATAFADNSGPCWAGCDGSAQKLGLCNAHYLRLVRHGSPFGGSFRRYREGAAAKFARYTEDTPHGLVWTGWTNERGYGRFVLGGRQGSIYAHRYAWQDVNGPIPAGLVIDHDPACPKSCVTVAHLQLITPSLHALIGWHRGELEGGWPHRPRTRQDPGTGRFVERQNGPM